MESNDIQEKEVRLLEFTKSIIINKLSIAQCKAAVQYFRNAKRFIQLGTVTPEQVLNEERVIVLRTTLNEVLNSSFTLPIGNDNKLLKELLDIEELLIEMEKENELKKEELRKYITALPHSITNQEDWKVMITEALK